MPSANEPTPARSSAVSSWTLPTAPHSQSHGASSYVSGKLCAASAYATQSTGAPPSFFRTSPGTATEHPASPPQGASATGRDPNALMAASTSLVAYVCLTTPSGGARPVLPRGPAPAKSDASFLVGRVCRAIATVPATARQAVAAAAARVVRRRSFAGSGKSSSSVGVAAPTLP